MFFVAHRPTAQADWAGPGRHQARLVAQHPFAAGQRRAEPSSVAIVARRAASHLAATMAKWVKRLQRQRSRKPWNFEATL